MIGVTLQKKRREKKVSLKKASEDTKIRIKYLIALEEENYDIFPADVYLKGFLRNYADYLGLDGRELVQIYEEQYPDIKIKPEISLNRLRLKGLRINRIYRKIRVRNVKLIFIGIIAIIFIWLIPEKFFYYSVISEKEKSSGKDLVSSERQNDTLRLEAHIKAITWIRVIADGVTVAERNFYPGEIGFWEAKDNFKLRIGNVWGLDLRLNGKLVDIISPSEEAVLDLILDKEDINDTAQ